MRRLRPLHPLHPSFGRPRLPVRRRCTPEARGGSRRGFGVPARARLALLAGLGAALVCFGMATPAAQAQGTGGEEVYQSTCRTCHERGQMKAPIVGDRKAWAPLIKEGQATLTGVAWVGIRRMPPRGGNPDLTLEEFARATVHMANAAGANWTEPDEALLARIRAVEKRQLERQKK